MILDPSFLIYPLSPESLIYVIAAAAAAAKSLQSCPTLCDPRDGSPPGSPSLGFSRQEHWSGLPFPSPVHESEVAQSCLTLSDPMDCNLPGSVHGILQARVLEWGAIAFSDICNYYCHNLGPLSTGTNKEYGNRVWRK